MSRTNRHLDGGKANGKVSQAALALRLAGASFGDIATTLGLQNAHSAMTQVEKELASHLSHDGVEEQRAEATLRLEALLLSVWPKATNETDPEHIPAIRMALGLVDRIIRLHGLDRPTEIVLHTPTAAELERWVANIVSRETPDIIEADVVAELT